MRVAINARLIPNAGSGGVEGALVGLVHALGRLDGPEEYLLLTHPTAPEWLQPYAGPNQRIVVGNMPPDAREPLARFKRLLGPFRSPVRALWQMTVNSSPSIRWPWIEESRGFLEGLDCAVAHFPYQCYVRSRLPSVYNPHDLQHRHFPQFFDSATITLREKVYRAACGLSHTVVAGSQWIKNDLVEQYGLPREKVQVIPWAPPTQVFEPPTPARVEQVRSGFGLQLPFAYYPAMIWGHKNHIRLLEALAQLRDRYALRVNLVCTGQPYPAYWPHVEGCLHRLGLGSQVRFLGMVSSPELRALYHLAQFVVVPTLFEAASGPVFEAWQEDVAVACSNVTSLPEQTADAALLFDPLSVDAIAEATMRMHIDAELRTTLIRNGRRRLRDFSWERTAKAYRAVYRRAAGLELSDEDRDLLSWDWARDPRRTGRA